MKSDNLAQDKICVACWRPRGASAKAQSLGSKRGSVAFIMSMTAKPASKREVAPVVVATPALRRHFEVWAPWSLVSSPLTILSLSVSVGLSVGLSLCVSLDLSVAFDFPVSSCKFHRLGKCVSKVVQAGVRDLGTFAALAADFEK